MMRLHYEGNSFIKENISLGLAYSFRFVYSIISMVGSIADMHADMVLERN